MTFLHQQTQLFATHRLVIRARPRLVAQALDLECQRQVRKFQRSELAGRGYESERQWPSAIATSRHLVGGLLKCCQLVRARRDVHAGVAQRSDQAVRDGAARPIEAPPHHVYDTDSLPQGERTRRRLNERGALRRRIPFMQVVPKVPLQLRKDECQPKTSPRVARELGLFLPVLCLPPDVLVVFHHLAYATYGNGALRLMRNRSVGFQNFVGIETLKAIVSTPVEETVAVIGCGPWVQKTQRGMLPTPHHLLERFQGRPMIPLQFEQSFFGASYRQQRLQKKRHALFSNSVGAGHPSRVLRREIGPRGFRADPALLVTLGKLIGGHSGPLGLQDVVCHEGLACPFVFVLGVVFL
mmetsp:Transcript_34799/g.96007  ORF Transcript_34799/g.96007 Transcript_34799/m.96007 type:complete len:354 (+) Transcript_34799:2888-3949(+)